MRNTAYAVVLWATVSLMTPGIIEAAVNIKVLVMDKGFEQVPDRREQLELVKQTTGELILGGRVYEGIIEVWRGEKGLYLINEVPLEAYVAGVVAAESGENWSYEALKAQAVAVRTYTLYQISQKGDRFYDVTSSVLHQLYKGLNTDSLVYQAAQETEGQVITYNGDPIAAYYHSTCGGITEDAADVFGTPLPYLVPVESSCTLSPLSKWEERIPLEQIARSIGHDKVVNISINSLTSSGRAGEIEVIANPEGVLKLPGKDLRKALGWRKLPSTLFTVSIEGGDAVFSGRGYGHGVGLCQWGAQEMALGGRSYLEILSHYYPGTSVSAR